MKPRRVLIDTDILSYQLAHHPKVGKKVERYVKRHREVSISVITAFEYMRGLHELKNYNPKKAQEKIEAYRAFLKSLHVALRRPETMKRTIVMRFRLCGKIKQDERWSEVDSYLSFNSLKSLTRVAQTRPKLSHRQAPEGR